MSALSYKFQLRCKQDSGVFGCRQKLSRSTVTFSRSRKCSAKQVQIIAAAARGKEPKVPLQQRVINGILSVSNVPYSVYIPEPITALHRIDAVIKQIWIFALYLLIARANPIFRFAIASSVAALSIVIFPRRLWEPQLKRLGILCAFILLFTALGADGVPPVLQARDPSPALQGLPAIQYSNNGYSYVILQLWIVTITRRSINLAITASTLTFTALQFASLCLMSTPGEDMALGLKRLLSPLKLLKVPIEDMTVTLLLSLRFMSLVFGEVRNLCLGLAARNVNWEQQGQRGTLQILGKLFVRLFQNLFQKSESIAQSMNVRGFTGPENHQMYLMKSQNGSFVHNAVALFLLVALCWVTKYYK